MIIILLCTQALGLLFHLLIADCSSRQLIKKNFGNEFSGWLDSGLIAVYAKIPIFKVEDEITMGQGSSDFV